MKTVLLMCVVVLALLPAIASAQCTYGDARSASLEVTNLQAALMRERMGLLQAGQEVPSELTARIDALEAELKPLRDAFAAAVEAQALSIQDATPMDASFCDGLGRLLQAHAPPGYTSAPITLSAASPLQCKGIDDTTLWQRYGDAMQAQVSLVQSGRVGEAEALSISQKFSLFGTQMSTDAAAACATLLEIERDLEAFER